MNKRASEMTIGTLVIIVLAIIVLVVLVLGFGTGWSNLWEKITGYSSKVNVDAVRQSCTYSCSTKASYDYCCLKRDLVFMNGDKKDSTKYTGTNAMTCNDYTGIFSFDSCSEFRCDSVQCQSASSDTASSTNSFPVIVAKVDLPDKEESIAISQKEIERRMYA